MADQMDIDRHSRQRIHFGSLEENERANQQQSSSFNMDMGLSLDDLQDLSESYELVGSSKRAREEHQAILDEFERRKRARNIAVPTDDMRVKARLRELGEPITLFGEGPGDRRDRLRALLSKQIGGEDVQDESESESESEEEKEEEFFTEGSQKLLESRRWIAKYSIPRAKARIMRERLELDLLLPQLKQVRKELNSRLQSYINFSSQVGDDRPIAQVAFSPLGNLVSTGAWSGSVKIWSVPQSELLYTLRGHNDRVGGIAWHPGSGISVSNESVNIATGGADGKVLLWNFTKSTPLANLVGHNNRVARVGFHPSGRFLGTASFDGTWRLWDVETANELLLQEGHSKEVYSIAFQDDGALVASGGMDAVGRVWDLRSGRSAMVLEGHVKEILGISFSPSGYQLATGSGDNTVRIWDIRSLRCVHTIAAHKNLVSDVKFFRQKEGQESVPTINGLYLTSSSYDGSVKVWSADDWKCVKSLEGHEGKVMGVDISSDNQFIVSGGSDRTFKLWASDTMELNDTK